LVFEKCYKLEKIFEKISDVPLPNFFDFGTPLVLEVFIHGIKRVKENEPGKKSRSFFSFV
jgi:hypothetical protein